MNDQRQGQSWLVLITVWATFLLYGAIAAPLPGVNEPHYLCKAKHYWQPTWCAHDFFLSSPNAHTVFYATVGSLTNVFSLEQSAWIGRALAMLVLSWGWTSCLSQLFFSRWSALSCACIFLAFAACGNFSGEWLVGGIEGKVFAYGLMLGALGDWFRGREGLAAIWCGLAISFHPVVGVWGLLAFVMSCLSSRFLDHRSCLRSASAGRSTSDISHSSMRQHLPFYKALWQQVARFDTLWQLALITAFALPGLLPVVQLLTAPVTEEVRYQATYIQVYYRLAHHLDPMKFSYQAYIGYAILILIWIASLSWGGRTRFKRMLDHVVFWAIVFALGGVIAGYGPRPPIEMPWYDLRMHLLKFYPFRLADVLVPLVVAISLTAVLERTWLIPSDAVPARRRLRMPVVVMALVYVAALCRAHLATETNAYSGPYRSTWLEACQWINQHLPADALVQSPTNGWAFKWFAGRAEYVAFKDCPQDPQGIIEWNRRLSFLEKWYQQKYVDQFYSREELLELHQLTGITHLLTNHLGPLDLKPIHDNGTFQVYDLTSLTGPD